MFPYKTMSLYRTLHQAARLTPVLALGLALGGCSVFHARVRERRKRRSRAADDECGRAPSQAADAAEPLTVTSNLPDVEPDSADATAAGATTTVMPDASTALSPTAPKSYVVQNAATRSGASGQHVPQGSLAVAGDLVRQPRGQQPASHLSGRHLATGERRSRPGRRISGRDPAAAHRRRHAAPAAAAQHRARSADREHSLCDDRRVPLAPRRAHEKPGRNRALRARAARPAHDRRHRQRYLHQPPESRRGRALHRAAHRRQAEGSGWPRNARLSGRFCRRRASFSRG